MLVFQVFIKVMKPVIDIGPFSALFELLELGLDVLFEGI